MSIIIDNYITETIISVNFTENGKAPSLETCQQIMEVAENSPASQIPVEKGDILITINDTPSVNCNLWIQLREHEEMIYKLYRPSTEQFYTVRANPIPLGINIMNTADTIAKMYSKGQGRHEDLLDLWVQQDFKTLCQVVQSWKKPSWIGLKYQTLVKKRREYSWIIEYLFYGVALYEQGKEKLGIDIISDFSDKYAEDYQLAYWAIIDYYQAKWIILTNNQVDEALDYLSRAWSFSKLNPIKLAVQTLGYDITVKEENASEKFPVNYCLPEIDGKQQKTLKGATEHLSDGATHLICILPGFRSYQPYDRFMERFIVLNEKMEEIFQSLHVIAGDVRKAGWEKAENMAVKRGCKVNVLYDKENSVAEALESATIPDIYGVNKLGQITLTDQLYTEVDLWNWLSHLKS